MRGRILSVLAVTMVVGALAPWGLGVASADHPDQYYLAQDPGKQRPFPVPAPPTENWAYRFWHLGSDAFWWVDPAAYPSLESAATVVISNWEGAIPELPFGRQYNEAAADLRFKTGADCGPQQPACIIVTDWHTDANQDANFLLKAEIILAPIYYSVATEEQKQEAIAHELGHFYGLHERYIGHPVGPSSCNGEGPSVGEYTVMDTIKPTTLDHCDDVQGPTSKDIERVRSYWNEGTMAWLTPELQGTDIKWKWNDRGWSEYHQQFNASYWDGYQWVQYVQWFPYVDRIGVHEDTEARELWKVQAPPVRDVYHIACGHPWFVDRGYGTWSCSPLIWVPDTDLVGDWTLDEGSGTIAYDSSGYGNDGTLYNGPQWVMGAVGNGLSFDGVNDYVDVGNGPSLSYLSDVTVTAWVRPTGTPTYGNVVAKPSYASGGWVLRVSQGGNGRLTPHVYTDTWYTCTGSVIPLNTWSHIALTYDGTTLRGYMDGAPDCSVVPTTGGGLAPNGTAVWMGNGVGETSYFPGALDKVRVYNRALNDTEVRALYPSSDLVGNWKMDESSGTMASDDSGYANHGTLFNGPSWVTGNAGNALSLDGVNDYVDAGSGGGLANLSTLTVAAWVKPSDTPTYGNVVAKLSYASGGWILRVSQNGNGRFTPHVYTNTWYTCSGTVIPLDQWTHVVLTYDGTTLKGYENGSLRCFTTLTTGGGLASNGTAVWMGNGVGEANYFSGALDEVRVYNRALNDTEVWDLYNNP